jgi:hypothetical protein
MAVPPYPHVLSSTEHGSKEKKVSYFANANTDSPRMGRYLARHQLIETQPIVHQLIRLQALSTRSTSYLTTLLQSREGKTYVKLTPENQGKRKQKEDDKEELEAMTLEEQTQDIELGLLSEMIVDYLLTILLVPKTQFDFSSSTLLSLYPSVEYLRQVGSLLESLCVLAAAQPAIRKQFIHSRTGSANVTDLLCTLLMCNTFILRTAVGWEDRIKNESQGIAHIINAKSGWEEKAEKVSGVLASTWRGLNALLRVVLAQALGGGETPLGGETASGIYDVSFLDTLLNHMRFNDFLSATIDGFSFLSFIYRSIQKELVTGRTGWVGVCVRAVLEGVYLLSFADDFVWKLLHHRFFTGGAFLHALNGLLSEAGKRNDGELVSQILRLITVLCEKEDPPFLYVAFRQQQVTALLNTLLTLARDYVEGLRFSCGEANRYDPTNLNSKEREVELNVGEVEPSPMHLETGSDPNSGKPDKAIRPTPNMAEPVAEKLLKCLSLFADHPLYKPIFSETGLFLFFDFVGLERDRFFSLFRSKETQNIILHLAKTIVNLITASPLYNWETALETAVKLSDNDEEAEVDLEKGKEKENSLYRESFSFSSRGSVENPFLQALCREILQHSEDTTKRHLLSNVVSNLDEIFTQLYCSDSIYWPIEDLRTADTFIYSLKALLASTSSSLNQTQTNQILEPTLSTTDPNETVGL